MLPLSQRLRKIAGLVPVGASLADIGTDHGYLSVFTVENGIAKKVYACDINEKPLQNARNTVSEYKTENIELRLCDGLSGIAPDEINCAVIAGMGAEVIIHILDSCEWIKSEKYTLILQPMTSPEILRRWLYENGFYIETELAVSENGKFYSIMRVFFCGEKRKMDDAFYFVGKLSASDSEARKYLKKQYNRFKKCAQDLASCPEKAELKDHYQSIADTIKNYIGEDICR